MVERLPLHTLLSHGYVAFTIECDNEFEHQFPHRTTKGPATGSPWLVSMAMWFNCMRHLGEEPIPKNVPTWQLKKADDLAYVLDNLAKLVVKEVQGSGGYGMLVGPASTKKEIETFRARILANPANYIAQPTLSLSTCPTRAGPRP